MSTRFARTQDGFSYKKATGELKRGLVSEGAICPSSSFAASPQSTYDLVVVGAGYAGLVAARDAAVAGVNVLLVEARDRIGGRSWTSKDEHGNLFEMGGTWIHNQQGFVWRELARYGMDRNLKLSPNEDYASRAYSMARRNGIEYKQDYATNEAIMDRAMRIFTNLPAASVQEAVPFPPHLLDSFLSDPNLTALYDSTSCADRVAQVEKEGLLTNEELAYLVAYIELCFGARLEKCSMLVWAKWYTHGNCSYKLLNDLLIVYKIATGQSSLARKIFDEAVSTGKLSYSFESPVSKVVDRPSATRVITTRGTFSARRIICTLPINVAGKVEFDPPVSALRQEAWTVGHVNRCLKVHSEIAGPEFRSWTGNLCDDDTPSGRRLSMAIGDQLLKSGNAAVVAFGIDYDEEKAPSKDPAGIASLFGEFDPELEKRYVGSIWHEWGSDAFSNGAWAMPGVGFSTKYLKELQSRHGNVLWAGADISDDWNSFIDGAVSSGTRAAYTVVDEWRRTTLPSAKL